MGRKKTRVKSNSEIWKKSLFCERTLDFFVEKGRGAEQNSHKEVLVCTRKHFPQSGETLAENAAKL